MSIENGASIMFKLIAGVLLVSENEHSFFFKEPQDHTLFREQFLNSDRIMDIQ